MGCLAGTFILANFSTRRFYAVSIFLLAAGMLGLLLSEVRPRFTPVSP